MRVDNIPAFYPSHTLPTQKLELAFLEEMMKYIVPQTSAGEFSGGVGEEQFSSFLSREYAVTLSNRLNLGLEAPRNA
ncbi:rod-binding protein [Paracoccus sp. S1E-3]|uniref:rod-binding protein n=1 Tax=Paracoccus sp. S1E-3 TaxID=2756130 RepID=UPI0015EF5523|nr:rod-binding protein [Paracoccus sp. S1E-3]MBA4492294.1 rod-binding protein [Paracoccus sp. S1E-3]